MKKKVKWFESEERKGKVYKSQMCGIASEDRNTDRNESPATKMFRGKNRIIWI